MSCRPVLFLKADSFYSRAAISRASLNYRNIIINGWLSIAEAPPPPSSPLTTSSFASCLCNNDVTDPWRNTTSSFFSHAHCIGQNLPKFRIAMPSYRDEWMCAVAETGNFKITLTYSYRTCKVFKVMFSPIRIHRNFKGFFVCFQLLITTHTNVVSAKCENTFSGTLKIHLSAWV